MASICINEIIVRAAMLGHEQGIKPQNGLIIFDSKDVISLFRDNLSRNIFLTSHRIN